ncbi:peroxisomal N(1)-acetyl-spermine/spermidine oxidase [Euwallacea fornicatus]|uniref:peroxisomal N(1)-acetyl-spermine/spermidine oxidase n=1 Tax=Euwallacea fornicatus TaxID=995702 RepID=UPI00338E710D
MAENGGTSGTNHQDSPNYAKVLIIGAGMAGLSAAYHLTRNNFTDFKLFEARRRLGGRIVQIPIGVERVELGANWIHGVLGNPVYELAMQHGLVDIMAAPKSHKIVAATEQGKQLPFTVLQEIYEAYLCFLKRCEEYFISQYEPPDGIDSVGEHMKLEMNLYLDKVKDPVERHLKELLFDCLLKRETCISGCDSMNEIDLLEIGSYTELQGGNIILPKGYSSILEPLERVIPKDKILRKHPVKLIKWNCRKRIQKPENGSDSDSEESDITVVEDGSTPGSSREVSQEKTFPTPSSYSVEVVCENNQRFYGDHLICTIPLGVLKHKATSLFKPPLPDYKTEAIDRLLFGTVDKILLEFERPFLHPSITEVLLLWEDDSSEDITKNWFRKIYSFSKITETLILGWISGKEAEYMETLDSNTVLETCTVVLRKFLNDPFIPKPKSCVCTSWHKQEYTRGSYTAIAVGASQIDIECLAQPLYLDENDAKPVLMFAGEHTHSNFYSTVHGAYLTGRTAAQTILSNDTPQEIVVDCEDETDLSSWIQGITLE